MKATGIVIKIQNIGKFTIPDEVRRTLGIENRDYIEIYIGNLGQIVLKKYDHKAQALDQIAKLEELILDDNTYTPEVAAKAINLLKEIKLLLQDSMEAEIIL
jgi:bifunctional DNA-binding transcriptional regulator/antitoxin component of YhaV-PrlF toxin-antitoxin module